MLNGARGGVVVVPYNNNIVIVKEDVKLLRALAYKFTHKNIIVAEWKLLHLLRTTPSSFDGKCRSKVQLIKTFVTGMGKIDATNMFKRATKTQGNLSMLKKSVHQETLLLFDIGRAI